MTEKQHFINACFAKDLQAFYRKWIGEKKDRIQFFTEHTGILTHKYWIPSNVCFYSKELLNESNIEVAIGYWIPYVWRSVHKNHRKQAMKEEAVECQKIDMSCNDCVYLDRANSYCALLKKTISINPNMCHPQNIDCFAHRIV
jgi:hypothetical protein